MVAAAKQFIRGAKKYADVVRELTSMGRTFITVGVQGDEAEQTEDDGTKIADIATWNEFGTSDGHVPQRSFMRSTFDERREELANFQQKQLERVADGKITGERANNIVGLWAETAVKKKIGSNIQPPNAQRTIDKKGSSRTLIDTGRLRQSITYVVHEGVHPKGSA